MHLTAQDQALSGWLSQSPKPKGCGNGKRRAKLGNRLGKDNIHLSFSTSCKEFLLSEILKKGAAIILQELLEQPVCRRHGSNQVFG